MYCPHCGAAEQNERFCAQCGRPTGTRVTAGGDVTVTVNVGSPVLVQPEKPSRGGVLQALAEARKAAQSRRAELEKLRVTVEADLQRCHEIIAEIESTIALDLLPAGSSARMIYARALEMRREALQLLGDTHRDEDLRRARGLVMRALEDLRLTERELR